MVGAIHETWTRDMVSLADEWASIISRRKNVDVGRWTDATTRMHVEQGRLIRDGLWVSGHADLMTVIGRHRDELTHSNVVAWLLAPTGRHGLGTQVLRAILEAGWPERPVPSCESAIVEREVPLGSSRADVVAYVDDVTLVIENKVDAIESVDQCEILYRLWSRDGGDVRFLLLSATGRPPASTRSPEAADAWRAVSYRSMRALVAASDEGSTGEGKPAVSEYMTTLNRLYPGAATFAITIGGGRVDHL